MFLPSFVYSSIGRCWCVCMSLHWEIEFNKLKDGHQSRTSESVFLRSVWQCWSCPIGFLGVWKASTALLRDIHSIKGLTA